MTHRSEESERGFTARDAETETAGNAPPTTDFATFVLSLAASALHHMGIDAGATGTGEIEKNLPLARQSIDTLAMLEEKTRGNLEEEESELLGSILYELRMHIVQIERGGA